MSPLKLQSLSIKNYRSLRDISVERIGRLNLITGPNNAGKTSLLEVIRIWAARSDISTLTGIIDARDESRLPVQEIDNPHKDENYLLGCLCLFAGYPTLEDSVQLPILITDGKADLEIFVDEQKIDWPSISGVEVQGDIGKATLWSLNVSAEDQPTRSFPIFSTYSVSEPLGNPRHLLMNGTTSTPCLSISSGSVNGIIGSDTAKLWDAIALTDREEAVLRGLRIIEPRIVRLNYIHGERGNRIPVVRLLGIDRPVPLRSLGDGVTRLFQILLALANAAGGFLTVDEFENGLHYSIQEASWRVVLELARELDVQVFATTHSNDSVEAFEQVSEAAADDMVLIRLVRDSGTVRAETLGSEKLALRLELGQEVR